MGAGIPAGSGSQAGLIRLGALLVLLLLSFGCASLDVSEEKIPPDAGQFTLFLNGPKRTSQDISFQLASASLVSDKGDAWPVAEDRGEVASQALENRQMLLGEQYIPEGRYRKLILRVSKATIRRENRTAELSIPKGEIEIPLDVMVQRQRNTTIFLVWDADESFREGYRFEPVLTVRGVIPELSSYLVYVTNETSGNVSVIHRDAGQVVATVMVGKKPKGVATSLSRDRMRVYVANSGSGSISVIDATTNTVETEIPIRYGREPVAVAVAQGLQRRELLFVANYGSNNLSLVDGISYEEIDRVDVGSGPVDIAVDPPLDVMLGSRFISAGDMETLREFRRQFLNVYVANRNSRNISVVRVDMLNRRFAGVAGINVDWSPVALAVDPQRGLLYVANYNADTLSVLNIVRPAAVTAITNVGRASSGVLPDPFLDRIYLLKETMGDVLIINRNIDLPGTGNMRSRIVLGTMPAGKMPGSIILDPEARKFYIVNRGSDTVTVIDRNTYREETTIPVGRRPYDITMFPF